MGLGMEHIVSGKKPDIENETWLKSMCTWLRSLTSLEGVFSWWWLPEIECYQGRASRQLLVVGGGSGSVSRLWEATRLQRCNVTLVVLGGGGRPRGMISGARECPPDPHLATKVMHLAHRGEFSYLFLNIPFACLLNTACSQYPQLPPKKLHLLTGDFPLTAGGSITCSASTKYYQRLCSRSLPDCSVQDVIWRTGRYHFPG